MSRDEVADDKGFEQFEKFLEAWSRRDFLKRAGAAGAYMAFLGGAVEFLDACAGTNNPTTSAATSASGAKSRPRKSTCA